MPTPKTLLALLTTVCATGLLPAQTTHDVSSDSELTDALAYAVSGDTIRWTNFYSPSADYAVAVPTSLELKFVAEGSYLVMVPENIAADGVAAFNGTFRATQIENRGTGTLALAEGGFLDRLTLSSGAVSIGATDGWVSLIANDAEAAATGGLIHFNGGRLQLAGQVTFVAGASNAKAMVNAAGGTLDIGAGDLALDNLTFEGVGELIKTGSGTLTFGGATQLGQSGGLDVAAGRVRVTTAANSGTIATGAVTIREGATLELTQSAQLSYGPVTKVELQGGTLELSGESHQYQTIGDLSFTAGGTVRTVGAVDSIDGFNLELRGNVSVGGAGNASISLQDGLGLSTANHDFQVESGRILTVNNSIGDATEATASLTKTGAGRLVVNGYIGVAGGTTVSAGTLEINGGSASAVTIASGATLAGTASFYDLVTLADGARVAPGSGFAPGQMYFNSGVTLEGEVSLDMRLGSLSDRIYIEGPISFADGATFLVNVIDFGDFAAGTYTLIDASWAWFGEGSPAWELGERVAGYDYHIGFDLDTGYLELTATASAIPEPSTYAMIFGAGALGLAMWCRKRKTVG